MLSPAITQMSPSLSGNLSRATDASVSRTSASSGKTNLGRMCIEILQRKRKSSAGGVVPHAEACGRWHDYRSSERRLQMVFEVTSASTRLRRDAGEPDAPAHPSLALRARWLFLICQHPFCVRLACHAERLSKSI